MGCEMLEPKNFDYLQGDTRKLLFELQDHADFLKKYSLVGGAALALYLCHRKSEDLDFFTFADAFEKREILNFCQRFNRFEILNESHDQLDLLIEGVKTTFFNARWDFLKPEKISPLNIASLDSIAAMKVNVLFLRAKYRDYYDVYFLADKIFELSELYEISKRVVPGLTKKLFCIALTYIDDIEDDSILHLEPTVELTKQDIRSFFEDKIRQMLDKG